MNMVNVAYSPMVSRATLRLLDAAPSRSTAIAMFSRAQFHGLCRQLLSRVMHRHHRLLDLAEVESRVSIRGRCYAGIQSVPIDHIRGSEGRCHDFDDHFLPLWAGSQERWTQVALARARGLVLPPVILVQVGDVYFVRDGHHRISVACALGETEIEAEVSVWQVGDASLHPACMQLYEPYGGD